MMELQALILNSIVSNEKFCRKVLPHIKPEYFEETQYRATYELISDFIGRFNTIPNATALEIEFFKSKFANSSEAGTILQTISALETGQPENTDAEWLLQTSEKWCKERAVYLAVMESIEVIDGKKSDVSPGSIPGILQKALSVTFDTNVGHDYIENADLRYDFYHTKEDKIPFDLDMFNVITAGGVSRKTLNILLAGCVHPDTKIKVRIRRPKDTSSSETVQTSA
jgi:hypothetical protein